MNNICIPSHHQLKKIQNYFQFRSAAYHRVNDFSNTPFVFIKKQTNIRASHPGSFYSQQKTNMNSGSNVQEYCRYRDAQFHSPIKVSRLFV